MKIVLFMLLHRSMLFYSIIFFSTSHRTSWNRFDLGTVRRRRVTSPPLHEIVLACRTHRQQARTSTQVAATLPPSPLPLLRTQLPFWRTATMMPIKVFSVRHPLGNQGGAHHGVAQHPRPTATFAAATLTATNTTTGTIGMTDKVALATPCQRRPLPPVASPLLR